MIDPERLKYACELLDSYGFDDIADHLRRGGWVATAERQPPESGGYPVVLRWLSIQDVPVGLSYYNHRDFDLITKSWNVGSYLTVTHWLEVGPILDESHPSILRTNQDGPRAPAPRLP